MSDIWTKALRGGPAHTTPRGKSYSNNRYGSKGAPTDDEVVDSADSALKRTPRQAGMYDRPWKDLVSCQVQQHACMPLVGPSSIRHCALLLWYCSQACHLPVGAGLHAAGHTLGLHYHVRTAMQMIMMLQALLNQMMCLWPLRMTFVMGCKKGRVYRWGAFAKLSASQVSNAAGPQALRLDLQVFVRVRPINSAEAAEGEPAMNVLV